MKLKNTVLSVVAVLSLAFIAIGISVALDNATSNSKGQVVEPTTQSTNIEPRDIIKGFSISLTGKTETIQAFVVSSAMPYAKIYVDNTGSGHITVTITKGTPTGTIVKSGRIKGGTEDSIYTNKLFAGTYYANLTSGGSTIMSGSASSRIASSITELQ